MATNLIVATNPSAPRVRDVAHAGAAAPLAHTRGSTAVRRVMMPSTNGFVRGTPRDSGAGHRRHNPATRQHRGGMYDAEAYDTSHLQGRNITLHEDGGASETKDATPSEQQHHEAPHQDVVQRIQSELSSVTSCLNTIVSTLRREVLQGKSTAAQEPVQG